jgi:hypothetical protein
MSMETETKEYFAESDDYEGYLDYYKDEQLLAFLSKVRDLIMKFEYCIDDKTSRLHINDSYVVAEGIERVLKLSQWDYEIEVEGKYQNYDITLEYDFIEEAKDLLYETLDLTI